MKDKLKYYIYVSDTKVDMLCAQIPARTRDRIATELKIDLKIFSTTFSEDPIEATRFSKLKLVTRYFENSEEVGTVDNPASFFRGTMQMRWGPFNPRNRSTGLVYFGGSTDSTILGLGGSEKHVIGKLGDSEASASSSLTPVLIDILTTGHSSVETSSDTDRNIMNVDYLTLLAVRATTEQLRGPLQRLEFLAKRLMEGYYSREGSEMRVLLGSPIYVALAE